MFICMLVVRDFVQCAGRIHCHGFAVHVLRGAGHTCVQYLDVLDG
jgi:hypothetical protein